MHPFLSIPEILDLICKQLRTRYVGREKSTLASLARTCKAWSGPALDSLWYSIERIDPLVECMPQDLWERKEAESEDDEEPVVLKRLMTGADVSVFQKYAMRVRVFSELEYPNIALYRALSSFCPNYLLPQLEKIQWAVEDPEVFPYLRLFLCPTLGMLDVWYGNEIWQSVDQLGFIKSIPTVFCPNISHLQLSFSGFSDPNLKITVTELSNALLGWRHLLLLELVGIPIDAIWCIAAGLPNLRYYEHYDDNPPISGDSGLLQLRLPSTPSNNSPRILALEKFAVSEIIRVEPIVELFKSCLFASLRRMDLHFSRSFDSPVALDSLLSLIPKSCNTNTLEIFHLDVMSKHVFKSSALIDPLLELSRLKRLFIEVQGVTGLSDQHMARLASSWPLIESLRVHTRRLSLTNPPVTLPSLIPFARGCPKLRELGLPIADYDPAAYQELQSHPDFYVGIKNLSLQTLYARVASLPSPDVPSFCASFLSGMFPGLEPRIYNSISGDEDN